MKPTNRPIGKTYRDASYSPSRPTLRPRAVSQSAPISRSASPPHLSRRNDVDCSNAAGPFCVRPKATTELSPFGNRAAARLTSFGPWLCVPALRPVCLYRGSRGQAETTPSFLSRTPKPRCVAGRETGSRHTHSNGECLGIKTLCQFRSVSNWRTYNFRRRLASLDRRDFALIKRCRRATATCR